MTYRAAENTVTGGFVGGGGGRVTIIKAEGAALNWFIGIQGEPGGDSMYFDIDCWRGNSTDVSDPAAECNPAYIMCHNAVIGHDNCVHGSRSSDPTFIYLDHGALHLGNFSGNPDFQSGAGGMLNFTETLQVEGRGYIKELSHGLPSRRLALSEDGVAAGVSATDDEPVLLTRTEANTLRIAPLRLGQEEQTQGARGAEAAYFEITVRIRSFA